MRRAPYAFTLMVVCLLLAAGLALLRLRPKEPEPLPVPTPLVVSPLAQPQQPPGYSAAAPVPRYQPPRSNPDTSGEIVLEPPKLPPGFKNWEEAYKEGHHPLLQDRGLSPEEYERQRLRIKANLQKAKQYEESEQKREDDKRFPQRPDGFGPRYVIPR